MKKLNQGQMQCVNGGKRLSDCDTLLSMADWFGIDRNDILKEMSLEQLMGCTVG